MSRLQVMVSAKESPGSSTRRAVQCFRGVQQYFFDRSAYPLCMTRLLVLAAQASSLLVDNRIITIADESRCSLKIYLTDIVSILSPGDVIIEVVGEHERVDNAIGFIDSYLRGFTVDEDMMLDLRKQGGIPTPYNVVYANECSSGKDQCKSSNLNVQEPAFEDPYEYFGRGGKFKVLESMNFEFRHFKTIPLSVVHCIMGLNGENIDTIQQSCLASIILEPGPRNEMIINIRGGSGYEVEVAKLVMEGFIGFPAFDSMLEGVALRSTRYGGGGGEEWF